MGRERLLEREMAKVVIGNAGGNRVGVHVCSKEEK